MNRLLVLLCVLTMTGSYTVFAQQLPEKGKITDIQIGSAAVQSSVKRLGMNLGNLTYYDAGQMTKNLVFRNPGFEGGRYQSIIRCISGTATTCVDDDAVSAWPDGFWKGAAFEIFYGKSHGRSGTIAGYTAAAKKAGGTFTFARGAAAPEAGDYMIVRLAMPGNATAGWWPTMTGHGAITTNTTDLPPDTSGRQAVSVSAPAANDSATLAAYFDSHAHRSFVLLNGKFRLSFRAKGAGGSNSIAVSLRRNGGGVFLDQTVPLTGSWAPYVLEFAATESGASLDSVALQFRTVGQDTFLMDDVSLIQTDSDSANGTAFRDPVLDALKTLKPGVLRFWGGQLGETLDNLIADPFGRQRAGYLAWFTQQEDISYGLHEFLQLCAALDAEPWVVVPTTFSVTEASNLIEYLAGAAATPYGSKRAARGSADPWTKTFAKIHLEFGNEAWNGAFKGGTIEYPEPYGDRAQMIFAAMRGNAAWSDKAFDLILGGQAVSPGRNQIIQSHCNNNDSFAIAPYMMTTVESFATAEDLYGSTFAEAEAFVSARGTAEGVSGGMILANQKAIQASSHPVPLTTYEMNLSTLTGTITQKALNSYVSSIGAGLAVADAMLQQMSHGVLLQNLWNLSQYDFSRPDKSNAFLWGAVVDMGVTNRRRPQYLALQLINEAIGDSAELVETKQTGANPTWNQPLKNTVELAQAHYLQSFAFNSGSSHSLIVFNLHRSASLPITFSGPTAPSGAVRIHQLTGDSLNDTNEASEKVRITGREMPAFDGSNPLSLPPYSMTSIAWEAQ